jgi:hypothetical protein
MYTARHHTALTARIEEKVSKASSAILNITAEKGTISLMPVPPLPSPLLPYSFYFMGKTSTFFLAPGLHTHSPLGPGQQTVMCFHTWKPVIIIMGGSKKYSIFK